MNGFVFVTPVYQWEPYSMLNDSYLWVLSVTDYYLPFPIVLYIRLILLATSSCHLPSSTRVQLKLAVNHRSLQLSAITGGHSPSITVPTITGSHSPSFTVPAVTSSHSPSSTIPNSHLSSPTLIHCPCRPRCPLPLTAVPAIHLLSSNTPGKILSQVARPAVFAHDGGF